MRGRCAGPRRIPTLCILGLVLLSGIATAQGAFQQQARLDSPDPIANEAFGNAVALSADGNTALVGDLSDTCGLTAGCGAAFVFVRTNGSWALQQKLTAPVRDPAHLFGLFVALSDDGDTALVGAPGVACDPPASGACGAAYVFVRSGADWSLQQELKAPDGGDNDNFDVVALSADGSTAAIGAINADCGAISQCGAVYIFERSGATWDLQQKITPPVPVFLSSFGAAVALSDDGGTLLVGEPSHPCPVLFVCGSVHVFVRSGATWTLRQTLTASDLLSGDGFGEWVALSGDGNVALVGAPRRNCSSGASCGAAYVYVRGGGIWVEQQKLTAADAAANDNFGRTVSLSADGSLVLIGAIGKSCSAGIPCGAAYAFVRAGGPWVQFQKLVPSDLNAQDEFSIVGISGDGRTALVGAPGKECGAGERCGAAYVLVLRQIVAEIPTVTGLGLGLLALLVAAAGLFLLRGGF